MMGKIDVDMVLVALAIAAGTVPSITMSICELLHKRDFMGKCVRLNYEVEFCLGLWEVEEWKRGFFQYEVNDEIMNKND